MNEKEKDNKNKSTEPPWISSSEILNIHEESFKSQNQKVTVQESEKYKFIFFDYMFIFVLFVLSFVLTFSTVDDYGLCWDEAYYYEPSEQASLFIKDFFKGDIDFSQKSVDSYWDKIVELPAFCKILWGSGILFFDGLLWHVTALRLPNVIIFSSLIVLIYIFVLPYYGRTVAAASSISFLIIPRIFGHSHIAETDMIITFMILLTTYTWLKGLNSVIWSIITGVIFGLALNTKINVFFLLPVLVLWSQIYHRKKYINNLFCILLISPIVWFLTWPWLWSDTLTRLLDYLKFHTTHQLTSAYYFGKLYQNISAPFHYPFAMTFFTLPVTVLIFSLISFIFIFKNTRSKPIGILILLNALVPLLINALPSSPTYDGIRLFMPAFPFIAIMSGIGLGIIIDWIDKKSPVYFKYKNISLTPYFFILIIFLIGIYEIYKIHPYELCYFNQFIGGVEGAHNKGMETTYWGEVINEDVTDYINKNIPKNANVKLLALHEKIFEYYQKWGIIREDIKFDGEPPYDFHILLCRQGFFGRAEDMIYNAKMPKHIFALNSVPLLIIADTRELGYLQ